MSDGKGNVGIVGDGVGNVERGGGMWERGGQNMGWVRNVEWWKGIFEEWGLWRWRVEGNVRRV